MPATKRIKRSMFPLTGLLESWLITQDGANLHFSQALNDLYVDAIVDENLNRQMLGIPSIFD